MRVPEIREGAPAPDEAPAELEQRLRYQASLLASQSEAAIEGILVVSPEGRILSFNRRFAEIWQLPPDVVESRDDSRALEFAVSLVADPDAFVARVRHLYANPEECATDEFALRDGRVVERYCAPVRGDDGTYYGRIWCFRDVTARKRVEQELRSQLELLRAVMDSLAEGLYAVDQDGRLTSMNRAAEAMLGWREDDLRGSSPRAAFHRAAGDGGGAPDADCPLLEVARTGRAARSDDDTFFRRDGSALPVAWSSAPIVHDERVVGAVVAFHDISERKAVERQRQELLSRERAARAEAERAHRRTAFLAEASAILDADLDLAATLHRVTRLAVPAMADWCVLDFLTPSGRLERVAVAHADPEKERLGWLMAEHYGPRSSGEGIARVMRTGEPVLYPEVTDALLRQVAQDPEHFELLSQIGYTSAIVVPLAARGRTLGMLTLCLTDRPRRYGPHDLELAHELGRRAATAIENARLYAERDRIAEVLQRSLLPPTPPDVPGLEVAARYRPAGRALDVGGDFYDVFQLDDATWAIALGDVCGKGAEAAATTALARYTLRAVAPRARRASRTLELLNEAMLRQDSRPLCSLDYVLVRPNGAGARLELAVGGQPLPVVVRADGSATTVGALGTMLGAIPVPALRDVTMTLAPSELLVLYTDGVTDAGAPRRTLTAENLTALLAGPPGRSAAAIADQLEHAALEAAEGDPRDDIAIVVLRATGENVGSLVDGEAGTVFGG